MKPSNAVYNLMYMYIHCLLWETVHRQHEEEITHHSMKRKSYMYHQFLPPVRIVTKIHVCIIIYVQSAIIITPVTN